MKQLKEIWNTLISSIKDLMEPAHRILAILGTMFLFCCILMIIGGMIFNFVENLFEIIGNTITSSVIGEPFDAIE